MATTADGTDVREMAYSDMTKAQCLADIGRKIGMRGHLRSRLTKQDLNSVYWYLTGEQHTPWIDFGTERSPGFHELRRAVADEVGFAYADGIRDGTEEGSRKFRRNELRAVVYALRQSDDNRQHPD
jgi:hypothetical protein